MGILPHIYLQHYSLLVSALSLLVSENITSDDLTEADHLIDLYCKELAFYMVNISPGYFRLLIKKKTCPGLCFYQIIIIET